MLDEILGTLQEGWITSVLIGLHWTAVMAEVGGQRRCGLASTLNDQRRHHGQVDVPQAGQLENLPGSALAAWAKADDLIQAMTDNTQFVLITHQHGDHLSVETVDAIAGESTAIIAPPSVEADAGDPYLMFRAEYFLYSFSGHVAGERSTPCEATSSAPAT